MPLTVGDRLGPYEILAPLGSGGMGEVYRARDPRLNRDVAIKRLKGSHMARFEQEARAIAALNHPHICQIYDVGQDYLVMEYVEGSPLKGPMPVEEAVRLARQIAEAMGEAHGKGILHRDLKPGNILVGRAGVKVLDFGLAKLTGQSEDDATLTIEGTVLGTAAYMSPEQAQGKPLDQRSDIFSFGAVLYELLSGQRPFTGQSMAEVLSAVLRDEPAPLNASGPVGDVVRKCMAKRAADRYGSMADVRAALERANVQKVAEASIAVLPFANISGDKDNEYFSDGLAEEIINALTHIPGLLVTARTSAFSFKGKDLKVAEIARELGVEHILEGSVRKAGNRIRVTAQLIKAATDFHLWSERYDRELTDVFAIQDEISAAIAAALQLKLAPVRARHQPKLPAYEAYLKYRYHQYQFTPDSLRISREYLEQAIALDPQFALAYAGLADHYHVACFVLQSPPEETVRQIRALAQQALELDPGLPEAYALLGMVAGEYDRDWKEAERCFELARKQSPIPAIIHVLYGLFYLFSMGRTREAQAELELYLKEDPLSALGHLNLGQVLVAQGLDGEGLAAMQRALQLEPNYWLAQYVLGVYRAMRGDSAGALACGEAALSLAPSMPLVRGLAAGVFQMTGQTGRAEEQLQSLLPGDAYGAAAGLYTYALVCGDYDGAVEWAGKAVEQWVPSFVFGFVRPWEGRLRRAGGWPALLKKANLPEESS